ncbi:hypothetical protein BDZ97DRAFT_1766697 [Flammula alnicola]|nr:hypothetical protein BDZ97DRAFT_1766697 [Flammula alnicola]
MELLPAELWGHICGFLGPPDLANLALTSSSYLAPARWYLYTKIMLRSDSPSRTDTFRLLLNNAPLARRTVSLSIETAKGWQPEHSFPSHTWIDMNIFKDMDRLRTVKFRRLPCAISNDATASEFLDLLGAIYRDCRGLTEVSIWGFVWPALPVDWFLRPTDIHQYAVRPNLQKVKYHAHYSSGKNSVI